MRTTPLWTPTPFTDHETAHAFSYPLASPYCAPPRSPCTPIIATSILLCTLDFITSDGYLGRCRGRRSRDIRDSPTVTASRESVTMPRKYEDSLKFFKCSPNPRAWNDVEDWIKNYTHCTLIWCLDSTIECIFRFEEEKLDEIKIILCNWNIKR